MSFNISDNKYYGYIYIIYNIINEKVYIGQTRRDVETRWKQHLLSSKNINDNNTELYKAMNKYGSDKFNVRLIKEYSSCSKDELIKMLNAEEIKYISEYNSIYPYGYNMQYGGNSPTESIKCPVDKYSLDGILLCSYESISDACYDSIEQLSRVHISDCCKGKLCSSSGYVWRYKGESFDKYNKYDKRLTSVDQYSTDGQFIKNYKSFAEAIYEVFGSTDHKKYSSHITSCCKGNRKTAYGYVWRYKDESFNLSA